MIDPADTEPTSTPVVSEPEAAVALPPVLEGHGAEDLCRQLLDRISAGLPITIDGQLVDRIATPCLQVLVAAARSARSRRLAFDLKTPSAALLDALVQLGLRDELAL